MLNDVLDQIIKTINEATTEINKAEDLALKFNMAMATISNLHGLAWGAKSIDKKEDSK